MLFFLMKELEYCYNRKTLRWAKKPICIARCAINKANLLDSYR